MSLQDIADKITEETGITSKKLIQRVIMSFRYNRTKTEINNIRKNKSIDIDKNPSFIIHHKTLEEVKNKKFTIDSLVDLVNNSENSLERLIRNLFPQI